MTKPMKDLARITKRIPLLLEQRDHMIYLARKEGATVVDIAEAADLSRAQVHRILALRITPPFGPDPAGGAEPEPGDLPNGSVLK